MDKIESVDLFDVVTSLDDKTTSKDSDYLKLSVDTWHESWIRSSLGTTTLTISVVYKSTADQEKKVDAKLKSVLDGLKLTNDTDYQKVKAIHNYIIKRVSYDQTYSKYTAYDALIKKTAVCEGYTAAAYRMFTDAGIQCRIITGIADGGAHSWNIVKVDGKWYNIDLTWDDPITNTGEQILIYNYFLKNQKAFGDHIRDNKFNTEQFLKAYPIAVNSYNEAK
jgi:transglutaminase/protease-like cytokinesis protein 3